MRSLRCKICNFIHNMEKMSGPMRSIKITDHFTRTSANVIYCITCTYCKKLYIGNPGRRLGDRFPECLCDVERKTPSTHVQYTRPESGCLNHQADWVRLRLEPEMGARRFISGTGSKRLTGARRVEDVGKRTRSDPMETVRPGKSRPHSPEVSSRETENIS